MQKVLRHIWSCTATSQRGCHVDRALMCLKYFYMQSCEHGWDLCWIVITTPLLWQATSHRPLTVHRVSIRNRNWQTWQTVTVRLCFHCGINTMASGSSGHKRVMMNRTRVGLGGLFLLSSLILFPKRHNKNHFQKWENCLSVVIAGAEWRRYYGNKPIIIPASGRMKRRERWRQRKERHREMRGSEAENITASFLLFQQKTIRQQANNRQTGRQQTDTNNSQTSDRHG